MVILFEGTCGVGKTSLLRAVAAHLASVGAQPATMFLQDRTYGPVAPLEDAGTLNDATNAQLLREALAEITREVVEGKTVLVDTFHVTQRLRPGVLQERSFRALDTTMAALPTVICFLEAKRETILERAVVQRRGTGFLRYAKKFSPDEQGLADYFFNEQQRMKTLVQTLSALPSTILSGETSATVLVECVLDMTSPSSPVTRRKCE